MRLGKAAAAELRSPVHTGGSDAAAAAASASALLRGPRVCGSGGAAVGVRRRLVRRRRRRRATARGGRRRGRGGGGDPRLRGGRHDGEQVRVARVQAAALFGPGRACVRGRPAALVVRTTRGTTPARGPAPPVGAAAPRVRGVAGGGSLVRRRRSHRLVPWSGRARALVVLVVVVIVRASAVVEVVEPAARLRPLQRRRPRGRVARRAGRRVGQVLARHVDDGADFGRGPRPPAQTRLQAGTVVHSAERRRRPSSFPWSDLRALTTSCCTTPTPFGQLNTETGLLPSFFSPTQLLQLSVAH